MHFWKEEYINLVTRVLPLVIAQQCDTVLSCSSFLSPNASWGIRTGVLCTWQRDRMNKEAGNGQQRLQV